MNRLLSLLTLLAFTLPLVPTTVSAQAQRLQLQIPQLQLQRPINRIAVNPYTPMLKRHLTAELHYVMKVCDPSAEQFQQIHFDGLQAVESLAIDYAELQRKRTNVERWPEPRTFLCNLLQRSIAKVISEEAAAEYREEIEAREIALRDANAAVVLNIVDQRTMLAPDQMEQIAEKLKRDWNPDWSTGTVMYLYPQYAVLPAADILRPFLTPLQQQLWSYRPTRRNVRLSWQLQFGANDLFGAIALPEFPEPVIPPPVGPAADPPEDAK